MDRRYKDLRLKEKTQISKRKLTASKVSLKILLPVIVVLFGCVIGLPYIFRPSVADTFEKTKDSELTMTFAGDVMLGRYIQDIGEKSGYSGFYKNVKDYWKDADISFINFESSVLRKTRSYPEDKKTLKSIYLSSSRTSVKTLMNAGVNAFAFGNNHIGDFGRKPIEELCDYMDGYSESVTYSGIGRDLSEAASYRIIEKNGLKVGFVSITARFYSELAARTEYAGALTTSYPRYNEIVNQASREADITVVYIHFGEENEGEANESQKLIAHMLIDAGADIVIGSHPHVLQEIEQYKEGIIFYSLGNFIFDQGGTYNRDSVLVQFTLDKQGNGKFELIPIRINNGVPGETANIFYINRIYNNLTRLLSEDQYYFDKDGHVTINAIHVDLNNKGGDRKDDDANNEDED